MTVRRQGRPALVGAVVEPHSRRDLTAIWAWTGVDQGTGRDRWGGARPIRNVWLAFSPGAAAPAGRAAADVAAWGCDGAAVRGGDWRPDGARRRAHPWLAGARPLLWG